VTALPAGWLPDRPAAERVARWLLHRRHPGHRFDVVDPEAARAALVREQVPGYLMLETLDWRDAVLAEEVARVRAVAALLASAVDQGLLQLRRRPELDDAPL
jgi:hypothetical protein